MKATLKRVQMLIEPEQHQALIDIANRQGKSVAEATRQILHLGIQALKAEDEFIRRENAIQKSKALRQAMRARRGKPIEINPVEDLKQLREERDARFDSSD